MYEDTVTFSLFGLQIYAYGLYVAAGMVAALVVFWILSKRVKMPAGAAQLLGCIAFPLSLILSRALYCAADSTFKNVASLRAAFLLAGGGYSMMGALAGVVFAALITAAILKIKAAKMLDTIAPAIMAFIAFSRLGEGSTFLGVSRPLVTELLKGTFLVEEDYDLYLRTYILEAVTAILILIFLLRCIRRKHRNGDIMLIGTLLYGASQTLFESLRYDGHMRIGFIGVQQIVSVMLMASALIILIVRAYKTGVSKLLPLIAVFYLPVLFIGLIGLEFMIDRSGINRFVTYGVYIIVLSAAVMVGFALHRRSDAIWTKTK